MRARSVSIVHDDPHAAGRDVALELVEALGAKPDLVLLFMPTELYDHQAVIAALRAAIGPGARIAGCTSMAEIGQEGALTGSVTAMGMCLDKVGVEVVAAELGGDPGVMPSAEDNLAAGRSLGEQLRGFDPKLVMLFADGVCSMPPELVRGLQETAGSGFPVVGGCASEREHLLVGTAQFIDDRVLSRAVVAVAFRGPLRLQSAAGAGFQSLGRERTCTRVEGKYMLEIDGRPAVEMYQQLLEIESIDDPVLGVLHPLAMVSSSADGDSWNQHEQVIRVVQKFDERGALLCGGDIHEGALVRITRATREDLLAGAVATCERALARLPEPEAAFIFNCAARKMILGPRHYRAEIDAVFELLPANLPRVGFYTYGELAPVGGRAMYHNATFTIVLMSRE